MAPELAERFARAALLRYGIPEDAPLDLLNISENATYCVEEPASGRRAILRVHRPDYSPVPDILSELAWTAALRTEADVRTAAVVPAVDGAEVVEVAPDADQIPRACVMFELLPGTEPPESDLEPWFERLGAISARMHHHARSWTPPPGFVRRTWDVDTTIGAHGHWGPWQGAPGVGAEQEDLFGRVTSHVETRLRAYGRGRDRFGLVHADLRLANLLVEAESIAVIDFDDCGYSWYLYDLATALTFLEHTPAAPALVEAWVNGYRRVEPLSSDDLDEISTFLMLRRLLVLAWINSHEETELAASQARSYTAATVDLASRYLER